MSSQLQALHSSVVSCLTAILSGHAHVRKPAEDELKALEVTEEFGLVLAQITASTDSPLQYRQLASIILKQYVECHWSRELDNKFQEPEPPEQVKEEIRKLLPLCLRDPQSKIRSTVAYAISAIASLDWPENWSNLFDELMFALSSGETDLVHGAMRVLSEFCHEISDTQLPQVIPIVLPALLKVIVQDNVYSVHTRARAVKIFHIFASLVYDMCGRFPDAPDSLLFPILPNYLTAFVELLGNSNHDNDNPGLRREIIMSLCQLLQQFPCPLAPHVLTLVTPVWNILVSSVQSYMRDVVNNPDPVVGVVDSDGEVKGQESTLFAIFEFISALSESSFAKRLLPPILPELVYHLIGYMQITEEQPHTVTLSHPHIGTHLRVLKETNPMVCIWTEDVTRFVEDDENEFSYSVRLSAVDLLLGMCEAANLGGVCCLAITTAMEKHLQETMLNSSQVSWKVHEACMLVCSCALQAVSLGYAEFDCQTFVERAVLPALSNNPSPFLTGRCLWLASKMGPVLKGDTITQLLQLVASGLQSSQPHVLRILSAKATFYFCTSLKPTEHAQLLTPYLPHLLRWLCEMSGQYSEDVVSLVIDSLQLVARVDPLVTGQSAGQLVPVATSLFLKYAHDPSVSMSVEELFQSLSHNPGCRGYLRTRFLPTAVEILGSTEDQMPLGLVPTVLDVLVHLVRGCGVSVVDEESVLVTEVFPAVVTRLLNSDDSAILQNGGECIRAYVSTCMEQLAMWQDATGTTGIGYVVKVIMHLLDPTKPEYSASFVGKLILAFVKKAGSALGAHLELLLRSVLSKLQSVASLPVLQSLLLVFAYLIQTELEAVLAFLSQVPDAQGQPALNFIMREWLTKHSSFYGCFEPRMSILSLCHILTHTLSTNDQRVAAVSVRCEDVGPVEVTGIITRSRRSQLPTQYTEVPVPVKIVKLIIGDIQNGLEIDQQSSDESDDEDDTIEDTLEALLAHNGPLTGYTLEEEVEQDPDLLDEPVLQLDMQNYLVTYMQELTSQPCFRPLLPHLTPQELGTLTKAGIKL